MKKRSAWMFSLLAAAVGLAHAAEPYKIISYLPGWQSQKDLEKAAEVLPQLTYGMLSFLEVKPDGTAFVSAKAAPGAAFWHKAIIEARKKNPDLKCQWVIGGWDGTRNIAKVAQTEEGRNRLAITATAIMQSYSCNGLDLDWEHPVTGGDFVADASEADRGNYILLLKALRAELERQGKADKQTYVLTAAWPVVNGGWVLSGYDPAGSAKELDWLNLMAYDYYGGWGNRSGLQAQLYGHPKDPDGKVLSIDLGIKYLIEKGFKAEQLVLGVPFYYRAQAEVEPGPLGDGLLQPAKGHGLKQYAEPGAGPYYVVTRDLLGKPGWKAFRSKEAGDAPYLYNAKTREFVSYDDPRSLTVKMEYVKANGLSGVMIWELTQDDAKHSLFNSLTKALKSAR